MATNIRQDPALAADAEELHDALTELVRVYQFRDRDRICCHDVSVTQCYALETVLDDGPMTLNALAARLYLDKSTASRVVSALERKGYVARKPHPGDGRSLLISATAAGRRLSREIREDLVCEAAGLLADQPREVRLGAARLLRRIARAAAIRSGLAAAAADACVSDCSR